MPVSHEHEVEYIDAKQAYKHCADKLRELKKSKNFYLGASSDPDGQFDDLSTNHKMKNMYTLCKVPTEHKTVNMMKKMMKVFGKQKHCINESQQDEEGNVIYNSDGLAKKDNYVYVMFR